MISVGMPTYNGEHDIGHAFASLLAQSETDFELIISDDGSTDNTAELAYALAEHDARVRVLAHERYGVVGNFHIALAHATGDYFMWAAQDDQWHPDYIARLKAQLDRHPDAVLAFCPYHNIDEGGRVVRSFPAFPLLSDANPEARLRAYLDIPEWHGKATMIYGLWRREALCTFGGYQEYVGWGDDMLTILSMLELGPAVWDTQAMFYKRLTPSEPDTAQNWLDYFDACRDVINGTDLPDAHKRGLQAVINRRQYG